MFPRNRFAEAGASAQEVDRIEREFDAAAPANQQGLTDYWASIAQGDLTEWLAQWRLHYEELPTGPQAGGEGGESGQDAPDASPAPSASEQDGPGNDKSPAVEDAPAADPPAPAQAEAPSPRSKP